MSDQPALVPILKAVPQLGGLSKPKLYKLLREEAFPFDGTLPVLHIGDRWYVRSVELERFLAGDTTEDVA